MAVDISLQQKRAMCHHDTLMTSPGGFPTNGGHVTRGSEGVSVSRTERRRSTKKMAEQKYLDHVVTGDEVGEHGTHLKGYAERTEVLPLRTIQRRIQRGRDKRKGTALA